MTHDRDLDAVLDRFLDEGPTRLADRVVAAAMTDVRTTRQRGARGALLEDFLMRFQPLAAPLAMAAVLAVAIGVAAVVIQPAPTGPDPSPTAGATSDPMRTQTEAPSPTVATAPPSLAPTIEPSPAPTAEKTLQAGGAAVPFSLTVPSEWERDDRSFATVFQVDTKVDTAGDGVLGQWLFFFAPETDETVEARVERFESNPQLLVTEPEPIDLGGASGFALDVRLNPEDLPDPRACARFESCLLITAGAGGWLVLPDRPNRIWIVDVAGDTVLIGTSATEGAFESWTTAIEAVLATIEWQAIGSEGNLDTMAVGWSLPFTIALPAHWATKPDSRPGVPGRPPSPRWVGDLRCCRVSRGSIKPRGSTDENHCACWA